MTKKDYIKAAEIVRKVRKDVRQDTMIASYVQESFVTLFRGDNPMFDVDRFRTACEVKS